MAGSRRAAEQRARVSDPRAAHGARAPGENRPPHLRRAVTDASGRRPWQAARVPPTNAKSSSPSPRRPPSIPIGGDDHGTWKLSLSGQGCPSGSVGSPFGSGSLPLPLPRAPRGRSSWRCRILTAAFPRVCKCGGGRSAGMGCGFPQNRAPLGPYLGWELPWQGS